MLAVIEGGHAHEGWAVQCQPLLEGCNHVPYAADALLITSDMCDVLPPPLPANSQSQFHSLELSTDP